MQSLDIPEISRYTYFCSFVVLCWPNAILYNTLILLRVQITVYQIRGPSGNIVCKESELFSQSEVKAKIIYIQRVVLCAFFQKWETVKLFLRFLATITKIFHATSLSRFTMQLLLLIKKDLSYWIENTSATCLEKITRCMFY